MFLALDATLKFEECDRLMSIPGVVGFSGWLNPIPELAITFIRYGSFRLATKSSQPPCCTGECRQGFSCACICRINLLHAGPILYFPRSESIILMQIVAVFSGVVCWSCALCANESLDVMLRSFRVEYCCRTVRATAIPPSEGRGGRSNN